MDVVEKEPERGSIGVQAAEAVLRILDSFVGAERLMPVTRVVDHLRC